MSEWQPIETAPKGGGAETVVDPRWVEPPVVLLYCGDGDIITARWDWYYAPGGNGDDGRSAWVGSCGDRVADWFDEPTHWMPLPAPPHSAAAGKSARGITGRSS